MAPEAEVQSTFSTAAPYDTATSIYEPGRHMKAFTVLVITSVAIATPSHAQVGTASDDWKYLTSVQGGGDVYIKNASLKSTGLMIRKAWFKTEFKDGNTLRITTLEEFDCPRERSRIEVSAVYYRGGDVSSEKPTDWQPVIPESVADAKMAAVCFYHEPMK